MPHFQRSITPLILQSLQEMPAVFLNGPRQAGKSTLVTEIMQHIKADYVTLDNISVLSAAESDPVGFLHNLPKPIIIDEVQLVPDLSRVIKQHIDEMRLANKQQSYGQFLLTGSANIMALPMLAEALVGRMQILTLYPLSIGEALKKREGFIDTLFNQTQVHLLNSVQNLSFDTLVKKATFPEIASNLQIDANKWFESYLTTLLQRDVRALAEIEKISLLPKMLKLIAARAGSLLNDASLARDVGLNAVTYHRYHLLLQHLFLLITVPPWFRNINKRLVKSPKIYLTDTYLLCYLLGIDISSLQKQNPELFGHVLENWVASELTKQLTLHNDGTLYHFRTQDNKEIDFIIERRDSTLIGIEVKSSQTVTTADFSALKMLQETLGDDFVKGIVLYLGKGVIPFGKKLYAMPISTLWSLGAEELSILEN